MMRIKTEEENDGYKETGTTTDVKCVIPVVDTSVTKSRAPRRENMDDDVNHVECGYEVSERRVFW